MTNTKNIVIVTHYYPPHIGGIEFVAFNQAAQLSGRGNNVAVVTSLVNDDEKAFIQKGVRVIRVKALNLFEKRGVPFPLFSFALIPVLYTNIKQADVVHIHDVFYLSSLAAVIVARWLGKPIILTQHVEMIKHPSRLVMFMQSIVYSTWGKYIFNKSKRIITLNDRVKAFIMNHGVKSEKFVDLPNGTDVSLFSPVNLNEKHKIRNELRLNTNKIIALFVGRFAPKKGFDKVLAAKSPNYQIVCVGDEYKQASDENVVFVGKLPPDQLAKYYRAADIFILPSESEGFPLSVQEAMSSGLAVVTTNDLGYERYKLDAENVLLLTNPTKESVKIELEQLAVKPELIKSMSEYSRQYALATFGWSRIIEKLQNIYTEAAS